MSFVLSYINFNKAAKIAAILVEEPMKLPSEYADFVKVFCSEEGIMLPAHSFDDHKIILEKGKTLFHGPIYNLRALEHKVLQPYIKTIFYSRFI